MTGSGGMGRQNKGLNWTDGGKNGRVVEMRVGNGMDVRDLLDPFKLGQVNSLSGEGGLGAGVGVGEDGNATVQIATLEAEVLKLRGQLSKATNMNDTLWKKIVDGSLKPSDGMDGVEVHR